MKLSPAQKAVLREVCEAPEGRPYTCAEVYAPAKKLVTFGLATGESFGFGRLRLVATDAGKAEHSKQTPK